MEKTLRVLVSSHSTQKIKAVTDAFQHYFSDTIISVIGVSAASGINEQPVGHEETRLGALNRIENAIKNPPEYDYVVGIENGIINIGKSWYDFGHVIIKKKDGQQQESISQMVQFPTEAVEETQKRGFDKVTVGKIMAEKHMVIDHSDPHASLTNKITNRVELISKALLIALGQGNHQ